MLKNNDVDSTLEVCFHFYPQNIGWSIVILQSFMHVNKVNVQINKILSCFIMIKEELQGLQ